MTAADEDDLQCGTDQVCDHSPRSREEGDQALFDRIAARYARKDILPSSALARREKLLFALAPLLEASGDLGTVVDVGCGAGGPAAHLRGLYRRYIGIDHAHGLIAEARRIHAGNSRVEFVAGNIKEQILPRRIADLILCDGALHHMTELELVMRSLAAIARPGAFIIAIEPQRANPLIAVMRGLRKRLDRAYARDQVSFSRDDLQGLFSRQGIYELCFRWQGLFSTPFAEVPFSPQALAVSLGRLAGTIDHELQKRAPGLMKRLAFNIVVSGRFPS